MKKTKKILLLLLVSSVIYVSDYNNADDTALAALKSDTVSQSEAFTDFVSRRQKCLRDIFSQSVEN